MSKKNKLWIFLFLSFAVPVCIMLCVLAAEGMYPFGDKTMFIMDMRDQYMEFYASLREMFSGGNSLFYNWSRSMGGNFIGLFAYYIASPLSFITALFPLEQMPMAIVVLTVLKVGLCGLSFFVYGSYLWKQKWSGSAYGDGIVLLLSVSYALLSYNFVYSLCPMWMDGVIMLPVVLLGVEKILRGGRGLHYMLGLAAIFICNYYTGYMVGIFTALYFVYQWVCGLKAGQIKHELYKVLRFTLSTLLALGLSAPLILSVVKDLMQGKLSNGGSWVFNTDTNFEMSDFFGKFRSGVYDSITNAGVPAVYCGMIVLAAILLFLAARKVSIREKAGAALFFVILTCSLYYKQLDVIWHGFQYPTWFPYRYQFVFSFFMVYLALRGFCALSISKPYGKLLGSLRGNMGRTVAVAAVFGMLFFFNAFDLGKNGAELIKGLDGEFKYCKVEQYGDFLDKTKPLVEEVKADGESLFRVNQQYEFSKNDALLLGYRGMTHYSSTYNAAVNNLTPRLGIAQTHLWNSGYGTTPLLDSLFSVKYIIADRQVPSCYEERMKTENGAALYENTMALPVAYSAGMSGLPPDTGQVNPFLNQNAFMGGIVGESGQNTTWCVEQPYAGQGSDQGYQYTCSVGQTGPLYLYLSTDIYGWGNVYANEKWVGNYFSSETNCALYLGDYEEGQQVIVRVEPNQPVNLYGVMFASVDVDAVRASVDKLREHAMRLESYDAGKLKGKITVGAGQKIMTSIPWDAGWSVYVDGEETQTEKYADTFMVIPAEEGEHEVVMSYVSPGFLTGMLIFAGCVVIALLYFGMFGWLMKKHRTARSA